LGGITNWRVKLKNTKMKYRSLNVISIVCLISLSLNGQTPKNDQKKVEFINKEAEKKIDVLVGGKFFTAFCWPENVYKPILYPVCSAAGTEITRGFPLRPKEGERDDHIHQVGIWLNYGMVNGHDFWGNGYRGVKEPNGGVIKHLSVEKVSGGAGEGVLISKESWIDPEEKELLAERTEYHFIAKGAIRIIDRIETLTARDTVVYFKDTKEGMFGIRVARQLELPLKESVALLDANGKPSKEKVPVAKGATGNYHSSEKISGEAVWGTRAKWMALDGTIGNEKISLVICDHPKNPAYPTYWHARGYGLFAANPFGWNDFTKGKEVLNFKIQPGKSIVFRYRVIINSGSLLTDPEIDKYGEEFSKLY
jgi:hypothetical protein